MNMVKRPVIVWDWDGTLVDSFPTLHKSMNQARKACGLPEWSLAQAKQNIAKSAREVFPQMFGPNAEKAEEVFYAAYADLAPKHVTAKHNREALLEATSKKGVQHLVVSNKKGSILRKECAALGWCKYFKAVVGANDATADKPSAAPVLFAYAQAGLELAPLDYYIGDAPIDAHTAKAANLKSILLVDETHPYDYLAPHGGEILVYSALEEKLLGL